MCYFCDNDTFFLTLFLVFLIDMQESLKIFQPHSYSPIIRLLFILRVKQQCLLLSHLISDVRSHQSRL